MALLGQGFDASGYTPDYSVANKANEQYYQNQQQAMGAMVSNVNDSAEQLKKQKIQEGAVKSVADRIDGIIKAFPDKKDEFDSVKTYLLDKNIPLDTRIGYSSGIDSRLNDIFKMAQENRMNATENRLTGDAPKTKNILGAIIPTSPK